MPQKRRRNSDRYANPLSREARALGRVAPRALPWTAMPTFEHLWAPVNWHSTWDEWGPEDVDRGWRRVLQRRGIDPARFETGAGG